MSASQTARPALVDPSTCSKDDFLAHAEQIKTRVGDITAFQMVRAIADSSAGLRRYRIDPALIVYRTFRSLRNYVEKHWLDADGHQLALPNWVEDYLRSVVKVEIQREVDRETAKAAKYRRKYGIEIKPASLDAMESAKKIYFGGGVIKSTYQSSGRHCYPKRAIGTRREFMLVTVDDGPGFPEKPNPDHPPIVLGPPWVGESTAAKYQRLRKAGWSYRDIADNYGVTVGAVTSQISKLPRDEAKTVKRPPCLSEDGNSRTEHEGRGDIVVLPQNRALLTRDVALILRTTRQRVYKLADSGELIGKRVGNRWIFDPAEVERFLRGDPAKAA